VLYRLRQQQAIIRNRLQTKAGGTSIEHIKQHRKYRKSEERRKKRKKRKKAWRASARKKHQTKNEKPLA